MHRGYLMVNAVRQKQKGLIAKKKLNFQNILMQNEMEDSTLEPNNPVINIGEEVASYNPSTLFFDEHAAEVLNTEIINISSKEQPHTCAYGQVSESETEKDFSPTESEYEPSNSSTNSTISAPAVSPFTPKTKQTHLHKTVNTGNENSPKELTKKRKVNSENWVKNKIKSAKLHGLGYKSNITGKIVLPKTIGPSCFSSCRQKCTERISKSDRLENFTKFYNLKSKILQWKFILKHVEKRDKKVTKVSESRRKCTNVYFLSSFINNTKFKVCAKLFFNTLNISCQMVETAFTKLIPLDGNLEGDTRGKYIRKVSEIAENRKEIVKEHINSFAPIESHYLRKQTTKKYIDGNLTIAQMHRLYLEWLKERDTTENAATLRQYRDIFNTCFNISFYIPKKDKCNDCSKFENMNVTQKENAKTEHNLHLFSKQKARELKEQDKIKAIEDNTVITVCFDFQKILTVPCEDTSIYYYKRKLCLFNFTLYELASHQAHCYTWDETEGKRGSNEVASCLLQFIEYQVERGIKTFIFYSDNCPGQNKNKCLFVFYAWACKVMNIDIKHVFLEKGHTQNEGDSVHALIEKTKKNKKLYIPAQWYSLIRNCKITEPKYIVHEMTTNDFLHFASFKNYVNLNKTEMNMQIKWSNIRIIKVNKIEPNKLFYKYTFDCDTFSCIILYNDEEIKRKQRKRVLELPNNKPTILYKEPLKISTAKYKDLLELIDYMPQYYKGFYRNLQHTSSEAENPENFEEDFEE